MADQPLSDVVEIARTLVQIPSVNPMGRDYSDPPYLEGRLTDFLHTQFELLGLPVERHEVLPGRDNLITKIEGLSAEKTVLLEVHQDTVPVDGMTIDPFAAKVQGGRLYGRGACDVKGGMAAMLSVLARLSREPPTPRASVVLACTVNEENGFDGARHLRELWESGSSAIISEPPDMIIVAEPTRLNVVTAHKGTVRWRCSTEGRAAHSSVPEMGENAIFAMGHLLQQLERYAGEIVPGLNLHPLVGRPSLSVGIIEGGISVNTVPDRCVIEIDRRLLPGEAGEEAIQHVVNYLNSCGNQSRVRHAPPFLSAPGLSDRRNGELARSLLRIIQSCGHAAEMQGVSYGTDASTLAGNDLPAVVFGPGDIAQAHTKDEWVELTQLASAAEILYRFCCSL